MIIIKTLMSTFFRTMSLPLTQIIFHQTSLVGILKISLKIHSQFYISILGVLIKTFAELYKSLSFKFSIICFSETWCNDENLDKNSLFQLEGYRLLHENRKYGRGGGSSYFCAWISLQHKAKRSLHKLWSNREPLNWNT